MHFSLALTRSSVFCFLLLLAGPISLAMASDSGPMGVTLTSEERAYLQKTPAIRMCVDPDWVPFEQITAEGRHVGIAADLIQLVAQRVGLVIELYRTSTWEESLAASKAGKCQILSFLNQTPVRSQWLIFTEPIFFDQNIVLTREEHSYIGDLKGVSNKTVALPRGTMVEERMRREYPNLRFILVDSERKAVSLVSERKADMTVRSLIVAAYEIKKEGLFNLKIAGHVQDFINNLRIGVIREEPELRDILNKGVKTLTSEEREAISNRHVSLQVQKVIDHRFVWKILGAAVLVLAVIFFWIRKLRMMNSELERLSVTDRLTGLFNRMRLDEVLISESRRAQRTGQVFSLLLVDVDHFKQINDTHGHQAGDRVLIEIARLLKESTRKIDTVGRWGGEEFLVICPNTENSGACQLAESLRQRIHDHDFPGTCHVTASFGVATWQAGDATQEAIMARADVALYAAKSGGRNCIEVR